MVSLFVTFDAIFDFCGSILRKVIRNGKGIRYGRIQIKDGETNLLDINKKFTLSGKQSDESEGVL